MSTPTVDALWRQVALLSAAVGRMQRRLYEDCTMPEYSVCMGVPGSSHAPHAMDAAQAARPALDPDGLFAKHGLVSEADASVRRWRPAARTRDPAGGDGAHGAGDRHPRLRPRHARFHVSKVCYAARPVARPSHSHRGLRWTEYDSWTRMFNMLRTKNAEDIPTSPVVAMLEDPQLCGPIVFSRCVSCPSLSLFRFSSAQVEGALRRRLTRIHTCHSMFFFFCMCTMGVAPPHVLRASTMPCTDNDDPKRSIILCMPSLVSDRGSFCPKPQGLIPLGGGYTIFRCNCQ